MNEIEIDVPCNLEKRIIIYDPFIKGKQPILDEPGETSSVRRPPSKDEVPATTEGDLRDYLRTTIAKPMLESFQNVFKPQYFITEDNHDMLLKILRLFRENQAVQENIFELNATILELNATVSGLNATVS